MAVTVMLIGWIGATLALVSHAQRRTIRLRQLSLLSSAALLTFNVLLGIWSNVALEVVLAVISTKRLLELRRSPPTHMFLAEGPTPAHHLTPQPLSIGDPR